MDPSIAQLNVLRSALNAEAAGAAITIHAHIISGHRLIHVNDLSYRSVTGTLIGGNLQAVLDQPTLEIPFDDIERFSIYIS